MGRPKVFHGGSVGVRLPKDIDLRLRAKVLETGRTISDLIRETLALSWGRRKQPQELQNGQ